MADLRILDFIIWVFILLMYNIFVLASEDLHVCNYVISTDDNCITDDCRHVREQPCFHGDCTEKGECSCHPCWAGKFCNETENNNPPFFREPSYYAVIPSDTEPEVPFLFVNAFDSDRSRCGWVTDRDCNCAAVRYSLQLMDKLAPRLGIHSLSGGIFLKEAVEHLQSDLYKYKVSVENLDGLQGSDVLLTVYVEKVSDWNAIVKSRKIRAAPDTSGLTALGNTSLDCSLALAAGFQSITTVSPGDRFTLEFMVSFPENYYAEDVSIEIFTDDVNGTFAVLCEPAVSVGANLGVDTITPVMEYNTDGFLVSADSAIISIGTVTNRGGSVADEDDAIKVTFDVTVVDDPTIVDGEVYWVSVGTEHYQGTRLWVGQLGFEVSREVETIPATAAALDGQNIIPVGQPHKFTFDIRTFKRTTDLTAKVSTADPALNSICRMEICSAGDGFCVDTTKTEATYTLENSTSWGHYGAATVPFGVIAYGGGLADNVASLITLDVMVYVPESTQTEGDQTLNVVVTEDGIDTLTNSFTYTPQAPQTLITPPGETLGVTVTPSCTSNPCELVPSQAVHYEVTLTVPAGATFTPVTIAFESEFLADGITPAMGSCSGSTEQFYQIDDDIACLGAWIKRADLKVTEEAKGPVFNLGGLTNMDYSGEPSAEVRLGVVLTFSPNAASGTPYNMDVIVNAGGTPTTNRFHVTMSADPATWPTLEQSDPTPAVLAYDNSYPVDSYDVPPGGFAVVRLKVTPEPSTQCPYILSVGANSTSLRLLDFRVTYVGSKIQCGDRTAWKSAVGNITKGDGSTQYDTSSIDLGVVTASRWTDRDATNKDAIKVEAIVQLSDDRAAVDDGSLHPVAMSALICSTRLWVGDGSIRVNYSTLYPIVLPTTNEMSFAAPVVDTVKPGAKSKILHEITLKETTCFTYTLNYTTDFTWFVITDVQLLSVGDYLPGLAMDLPTPYLGSHSGGHYAEIDFGSVCNVLRDTPTDSDIEDMTLKIEISVEFANSSDIDRGTWGDVTATMVIGNGDTTQESVTKIAYKADLPKTTFDLACPDSSNSMKPREIEACNLTTTMIDDELELQVEVETMLNSTAALNILSASVISVGRNIMGDFSVGTQVELTSADNTTQNNKAVVVGSARNTFTHTNESGTYMESDNLIVIAITFQMTDASGNEGGTTQRMEVGASAGTYMIWVCFYDFTVERDGTERPYLDVWYTYTPSSVSLVPGDTVSYHVNVNHTVSSSAEPTNLQIRVNLPLYVNFTQFIIQNTNERFPVPSYNISRGGVALSIDRLFFTDTITFTIETTIDSNFVFRNKPSWRGTTPLQVVYQMTDRDGGSHPAGEYFSEEMQYVTYEFTVVPASDDQVPLTCASPAALGMTDGTIRDCQITGSFQPDVTAMPSDARLNGPSAWKTEARGGPFLYDRWLKVDLGRLVTLTSIKTQGGASGDIGSFNLLYSVNDALYKKAVPSDEFNHRKSNPPAATILSDDIVEHTLQSSVEARYVVIQLTDYDFNSVNKLYNMLRVEFYGCATGTLDTDPCPAADTALHAYDRGFSVAGDALYVCDSQTHLASGLKRKLYDGVYAYNWRRPKMQCYVTRDGRTWDAMPEKVHNVVGYLPTANNAIYAIFEDTPGYARGEDFGSTWSMIPTSEYETAEADPGFVPHKSVPFVSQAEFTEETVGNYKATFEGIDQNTGAAWENILNWNSCCTPECKLSGINSC